MRTVFNVLFISVMFGVGLVQAEPRMPAPAAPSPSISGIEWDNARPEQRQALDHFYQSLQQQPLVQGSQQLLRQQNFEQLRAMTPEQRQQEILNYVQQYQRQQQLLLPNQ